MILKENIFHVKNNCSKYAGKTLLHIRYCILYSLQAFVAEKAYMHCMCLPSAKTCIMKGVKLAIKSGCL